MRKNVENTFTFIFPYLFNVFFSYPKRYLLVNKNQHWRSQFSKRNVCLSFTAFEERRGFDHSRVQFDDIVFSSTVKYSNSGSKRFRNMGPVVRRPISANPELNFNLRFFIPLLKSLFGNFSVSFLKQQVVIL